jgi:sirohydrochlorin ferrochelatase
MDIILLGHGSPDPRSAAGLRSLAGNVADQLTEQLTDARVHVAFLDHDDATLASAVESVRATGSDTAVVVPIFLSNAFHSRVDVPREVATASDAYGVQLITTAPLGTDPLFLDALERQVPAGRPVVLATAGTSDGQARKDLEDLAHLWSRSRGTPVMVAYASQAGPDVQTAIESLRGGGGGAASVETVVASFVLFDGVLPDRIKAAAKDLVCTPVLGGAPETASVVIARIRASGH